MKLTEKLRGINTKEGIECMQAISGNYFKIVCTTFTLKRIK